MLNEQRNSSPRGGAIKCPGFIVLLAFLNVLFVAVILWQGQQLCDVSVAQGEVLEQKAVEGATAHASGSFAEAEAITETPAPSPFPFDARQVESSDYKEYVGNLRQIGVPEKTVRQIVASDLRESFSEERRALLKEYWGDTYWQPLDQASLAELERKQQELDDELGENLQALLGVDIPYTDGSADWQAAQIDHWLEFLPEDKRARVGELLLLHLDLEAKVKELADGKVPDIDSATAHRILSDQERKNSLLWEMLTPNEFEEVELRTSWTADNLRRAMTKFEPTEEEFRGIFRIWREHDEELALIYGTSQTDPGNDHVFEQIEELLEPERYREYRETWWK